MSDLEDAMIHAHILQQKIDKAHRLSMRSRNHFVHKQIPYSPKLIEDTNRQIEEMKRQIALLQKHETKILCLFNVTDFKTAFKQIKNLKNMYNKDLFENNKKIKNYEKSKPMLTEDEDNDMEINNLILHGKIQSLMKKSAQMMNINETIKNENKSLKEMMKDYKSIEDHNKVLLSENVSLKSDFSKAKEQNEFLNNNVIEMKQKNIKIKEKNTKLKTTIQQLNEEIQTKKKSFEQRENDMKNALLKEKEKRRISNRFSLNLIHFYNNKTKEFTERLELQIKKVLIKVQIMISQVQIEKLRITIPNSFIIEQFQRFVTYIMDDFIGEDQPIQTDFPNSPEKLSDFVNRIINIYSSNVNSIKIE